MSSLVTSRGLPQPLYYAYMAGTCIGHVRQLMGYARNAKTAEWRCAWVKQARAAQREAREYMRLAKGAK